jgi:hypothetical protein
MILLLQGSTNVGRIALAEKIVRENTTWRHLPVEGLAEVDLFAHFNKNPDDEMLLNLACHLAKELHNQNMSVILSHQDATPFLEDIRGELGDDLITIHLHSEKKHPISCDYVLDAKVKSINELYAEIAGIIDT